MIRGRTNSNTAGPANAQLGVFLGRMDTGCVNAGRLDVRLPAVLARCLLMAATGSLFCTNVSSSNRRRAGRRAPGTRRRRALLDGDGRRPAGVDVERVVAAGDPGWVPKQPAGAVDAPYASDPYAERRQLRRPERGPAGGQDAGDVCGGGGNDGGGRAGPEQPVHGGPVVASGRAAGDRAAVPPGTGAGAGGDQLHHIPEPLAKIGNRPGFLCRKPQGEGRSVGGT